MAWGVPHLISTQVDDRLAEDTLYFERTGWNDGFMARKDPDAPPNGTYQARCRVTVRVSQLAILRRWSTSTRADGIAAVVDGRLCLLGARVPAARRRGARARAVVHERPPPPSGLLEECWQQRVGSVTRVREWRRGRRPPKSAARRRRGVALAQQQQEAGRRRAGVGAVHSRRRDGTAAGIYCGGR